MEKIITTIIITTIALLIFAVFMSSWMMNQEKECSYKGGTSIQTNSGIICIDNNLLK